MQRYLTCEQMRAVESSAFQRGIPALLPMEKAAQALFDVLCARVPSKKVLFVCGGGNNGADGLACARLWALHGGRGEVLLCGTRQTQENSIQQKYLDYLGVNVYHNWRQVDFTAYDAAVDALFGIGLDRPLAAPYPDIIDRLNTVPFILSADIPSGMNADTGEAGPVVMADETVTFHAPKIGMALTERQEALGTLHIRDVGFIHGGEGIPAYEADDYDALRWRRPPNAHKGTCGRVLIVGGDRGFCGAAAMCALGALKAGAGLVTILCEENTLPILQTLVPNAMCLPIADRMDLPAFDTLAAGCGLILTEEKKALILRLMGSAKHCVLDAGALPLAAQRLPQSNTLITPHMGEAARLLKMDTADVVKAPLAAAEALQRMSGACVVLKSAVTIIRDEARTAFNTVGTPALAKGGSGDALTGILAASLCVNPDLFEGARIGCLRMGMAGLRGEEKYGTDSLLTGEMLACLP